MKINRIGWFVVMMMLLVTGCVASPSPAPTAKGEVKPSLTPIIVRSPTAVPTGVLTGKVSVGPLTPVVRLGQPTATPPAEVYTSRSISIFFEDGKTLYKKLSFQPDGSYRIELPGGKYVIEYAKSGMDRAKDLPRVITIEAGKETVLDLEIDTGMR